MDAHAGLGGTPGTAYFTGSHPGGTVMDISLLLDYSDFFKGFSGDSKAALAAICVPRALSKREMLFHEGDAGQAMFICAGGNIRVFKSGEDGKESVIKVIGPGEIFAEVILFEQDAYPASAMALKKSLVYVIQKRTFSKLLHDERFRNDFIGMLMKKQRYLTNKIHDLVSLDVEERFIRFLEDQYGRKQEYRILIPKKDIASAIGTTSETFSRILARLAKKGFLTVKKDKLLMKTGFWDER
jgi:CRP/FNR family transcriptional regulator, dissimilatory nitrate respiration regulator